jgi:hypothetical protein
MIQAHCEFNVFSRHWMLTPAEIKGLDDLEKFEKEEIAYIEMQTTKPETLGFGLSDSPVVCFFGRLCVLIVSRDWLHGF